MKLHQLALLSAAMISVTSQATQLEVEITNLTPGTYFTPVLAAGTNDQIHLFELGQPASQALATQAEGGNPGPLIEMVNQSNSGVAIKATDALTAPGEQQSFTLNAMNYSHLSLTTMLLPTNDGFVGLDQWEIPLENGTYTVLLDGYDAGTELNDEIINGGGALGAPGIPADPSGTSGMGAVASALMESTIVHPHPGVIGDFDAYGGFSDLNAGVHRWMNPVAKLTITVTHPQWSGEQMHYQVGDYVLYNEMMYKVVFEHHSSPTWTPGDVWFFEAM